MILSLMLGMPEPLKIKPGRPSRTTQPDQRAIHVEVLRMRMEGKSNKEIARQMRMSSRSVIRYCQDALTYAEATGVLRRAEAG